MSEIEIIGTMGDGTFLARIGHDGRTAYAYYPAHLVDELILHTFPDFFTRFVVFHENDENMHKKCIDTLNRNDLYITDPSDTGLDVFFKDAMKENVEEKEYDKR